MFRPRTVQSLYVVLGIALAGTLWSCGGEETPEGVEVGCRLNSDCPAGQVCEASACVDSGECVGEDCPCIDSGDCGPGQGCQLDTGECFDLECLRDIDCGLGLVCASGRCETDVEADRDRDGVPDTEDLCPEVQNADQEDNDADALGDACDPDDDNDGVPDTADNCPLSANTSQADANDDGVGNVCDEIVPGSSVVGGLDFSAGGNPDTGSAQVFISSRAEPVGINTEGRFIFEHALGEPGPFAIRVEWPGFVVFERVFEARDRQEPIDIGTLVLVAEAEDAERAAPMVGVATLEGRQDHRGILVKALVGGSPVGSTLTDDRGGWVLSASRVDHSLEFSSVGFLPAAIDVTWDGEEGRFEVGGESLEAHRGVVLRPDRSASLSGALDSNLLEVGDWSAQIREVVLRGGGSDLSVDVQPNGSFALDGLVPGDYILDIDAEAHRRELISVPLASGDNDQGTIVLEAAVGNQAEVTLQGLARLAGETEHSGTVVRALIGNNLVAIGTTDAEGNFVMRTGRADHTLEVSHQDFVTQIHTLIFSEESERFEVLGEPLETFEGIVLQPELNASIAGRLSSSIEDFDFSAASVTLSGRDTQVLNVQSDGTFGQSGLSPGLAVLSIEVEGHEPIERLVTLASGDNDQGDIELRPIDATLTGRIVMLVEEQEVALEGVSVRLRRDDRLVASTTSDGRGEFVFDTLPVAHTMILSKENFLSATFEVDFEDESFTLGGEALDVGRPLVLVRAPESDQDADGIIDVLDNCPGDFNNDQIDVDGDGLGDACDPDLDEDGMVNGFDNCPRAFNPSQEDTDGDGLGTACTEGTREAPFALACGLRRQRLNTRGRPSRLQGLCGGGGSPEVVYSLIVSANTRVDFRADADFPLAIHLLDNNDNPAGCQTGGALVISGPERGFEEGALVLPEGSYLLVLDGLAGEGSVGDVEVTASVSDCTASSELLTFDRLEAELQPEAIAIGDLDNDGLEDLVVSNRASDTLSVYLGQGAGLLEAVGTFDNEVTQAPDIDATGPEKLHLADLDNDGDLDLGVIKEGLSGGFWVLLGDGEGGFEPVVRIVSFGRTSSLVGIRLDDYTGDGTLDLVATSVSDCCPTGSLFMRQGLGDGTFGDFQSDDQTLEPIAVDSAVGDFNGDGNLDLVTTNETGFDAAVMLGDGAGNFATPVILETDTSPGPVAVDDLDGDGVLDIVIANRESDTVSAFIGRGDGSFDPHRVFAVGRGPEFMVLGDLNGDDLPDIVTSNAQSDDLSILLGRGDGTFVIGRTTVGVRPGPLLLRGSDILVANRGEGTLSVLFNDGSGRFEREEVLPLGEGPARMSLADLNDDGHSDLVATLSEEEGVRVLLGDSQGRLAPKRALEAIPPRSIALADLNGDGRSDILTIGLRQPQLGVVLSRGEASHAPMQTYNTGPSPYDILVRDLNDDGHLDFVTANFQSDTLTIRLGEGEGVLGGAASVSVGNEPRALAAGDLNEDGVLDIVSIGRGNRSVLLSNGDGTFSVQTSGTLRGPQQIFLRDMNGDGHLDAVTNHGSEDRLLIQFGDGLGGLGDNLGLRTGGRPDKMVVEDFNNDGHLDMASTGFSDSRVVVFLGIGDGTFEASQGFAVTSSPQDLKAADFNRDGAIDLAVACRDAAEVCLLLGDGLGAFSTPRLLPTGPNPLELLLEDFDGDGSTDIAVKDDRGLTRLINDGAGAFSTQAFPLDGADEGDRAMAAGDLNKDGVTDLVFVIDEDAHLLVSQPRDLLLSPIVSPHQRALEIKMGDFDEDGQLDLVSVAGSSVALALGNNAGSFAPAQIFAAGSTVRDLVVRDFDSDGHLDVATVNSGSDNVSVLLGTGEGGFEAPQLLAGVEDGRAIDSADLDGDGILDLVVGDFPSRRARASVYLGDGQGGFTLSERFPSNFLITSLTLADMNQDGALDIVAQAFHGLDLLLGDGEGGFGAAQTISDLNFSQQALVEDVDRDGNLDIISFTSESRDEAFVVFLGEGGGVFAEPRRFGVGDPATSDIPRSIAAGDLDGDGHIDLVVSLERLDTALVLKGDGEGGFTPLVELPVGDAPDGVVLEDLNRDRRLDVVVLNTDSADLSVFFSRFFQTSGTLVFDSPLPPCTAQTFTAVSFDDDGARFDLNETENCRIERVSLSMILEEGPRFEGMALASPLFEAIFPAQRHASGRSALRPEIFSPLARFEGHPLFGGQWFLSTGLPLSALSMHINTFPTDPFAPDTLAEVCRVDEDQSDDPAEVCRLADSLAGLTLDDGLDEDVFLLDGAFPDGQTITLDLTTAPDVPLKAELRAFRAARSLALAEEIAPGQWQLQFTVPEAYSGRYFALHVRAPEAEGATAYDLTQGVP